MRTVVRLFLFAATPLALLAATARAQTNDTLAVHAIAQTPSGGKGSARLAGLTPPLLGSTTTLQVAAPGYDLGVIILTARANPAGVAVTFGRDRLAIYADPMTYVAAFPVKLSATGGRLALPLPRRRELTGLDLAWQAIAFRMDLRSVAATNLLLSNLGTATTGTATTVNFAANNQFGIGAARPCYTWVAPADGVVGFGGTRATNIDLDVRINGKGIVLLHQGSTDWKTPMMKVKKGDVVTICPGPGQQGRKWKVTQQVFVGH